MLDHPTAVWLPLAALALVLALLALGRLVGLRLAIWQIMLVGALVVLAGGSISPAAAWAAIDWEVIGFLFGVFVLGQALVASGWLYAVSARLLGRVASADGLVLAVLFASGLASAALMNDTLAVIGTPLVLRLAAAHGLPAMLLLLALAFGVTIGSTMSPIGNPQNLIIALQGGMERPFVDFFVYLGLPTLVNLVLAWGVLRVAFWRHFHGRALVHAPEDLRDPELARLARIGLGLLLAAVALRIALAIAAPSLAFPLTAIALAAALPLLASRYLWVLIKGIDWHTLVFFAALFVLMQSVWDTGVIPSLVPEGRLDLPTVLAGSVIGSQLISNVPLVALGLPLLAGTETTLLLALAAGATVAGNLTLIGAASNLIIAQSADRHGAHLGFWTFFAVGAPLTLINVLVYWGWLRLAA
ncbi:MAG: SLC13 family permease [Chromatiaceae bacterium]|jgi:Na+/H+ antiporter NhaD/arsenite permease-like protein|nr:SLC13 family permease [Chromatiaceae bacterium]